MLSRVGRGHRVVGAALTLVVGCTTPSPKRAGDSGDPGASSAGGPSAPALAGPSRAGGAGLAVTRVVEVACATDGIARQPGALADLDGDGKLDRPSVVREGPDVVVTLHTLPDLAPTKTFRLRADYVEVGTTLRRGSRRGDLWLFVGVAKDPKGSAWVNSVYHLDGQRLAKVADDVAQASFFHDVDGDGVVEPVVTRAHGPTSILFASGAKDHPATPSDLGLVGVELPFGQREPVDLDGDGTKDWLATDATGLSIVEAGTLRPRWTRRGDVSQVEIAELRGRRVVTFVEHDVLHVLDTDRAHTELATWKAASYFSVLPRIDVDGARGLLAVKTLDSAVADPVSKRFSELGVELATPLDDALPRLAPASLAAGRGPELVAVKVVERGSPMIAFPGSDAKYELVGVSPRGDVSTPFYRADARGDLSVGARVADLDGDGVAEILIDESTSYSTCDLKGGGFSAKVSVVDGRGKVLYADEERHASYERGQRMVDARTRVRAMDLWGDGHLALRMRSGSSEWYVLPAGLARGSPIPPCLE
jgi:hypothetical protein